MSLMLRRGLLYVQYEHIHYGICRHHDRVAGCFGERGKGLEGYLGLPACETEVLVQVQGSWA